MGGWTKTKTNLPAAGRDKDEDELACRGRDEDNPSDFQLRKAWQASLNLYIIFTQKKTISYIFKQIVTTSTDFISLGPLKTRHG